MSSVIPKPYSHISPTKSFVRTLDVRTGALALRADANLTRVFDHAPTEGRSSALLQCQVPGV